MGNSSESQVVNTSGEQVPPPPPPPSVEAVSTTASAAVVEVKLSEPAKIVEVVKAAEVTKLAEAGLAKKGEGITLAPKTTEAEDLDAEGQRAISKIWEGTQRWIALIVVFAGVSVNAIIIIAIIFLAKEVSVTQLSLLSISLQFINLTTGIVIGFYFSRTNQATTPTPSTAVIPAIVPEIVGLK